MARKHSKDDGKADHGIGDGGVGEVVPFGEGVVSILLQGCVVVSKQPRARRLEVPAWAGPLDQVGSLRQNLDSLFPIISWGINMDSGDENDYSEAGVIKEGAKSNGGWRRILIRIDPQE